MNYPNKQRGGTSRLVEPLGASAFHNVAVFLTKGAGIGSKKHVIISQESIKTAGEMKIKKHRGVGLYSWHDLLGPL